MRDALDEDPDLPLLRRVADGDEAACRALVDRHLARVHALAWRLLDSAAEADEIAQEAFLRAWRQAPQWEAGQARFSTWLHRVVQNLATDRLRQRRPQDPDALSAIVDGAPSAARLLDRATAARAVRAALARLPERQRLALALCHDEELTNIEAARVLEISVDALESLLARGRRALREALAPLRDSLEADHD